MTKIREIEEFVVDHEFYDWCKSINGKLYWDKFIKDTDGMTITQFFVYCYPELNKENN